MTIKNTLLLIIVLLLSACATTVKQSNWPQDIPSLDYFERHYGKDTRNQKAMSKNEYLTWIKRFYFGSLLYSRGWKQATAETIVSMQTPEDKAYVNKKMRVIGDLVAPEWAKNRRYRVINTRHIMVWGTVVNDSFKSGQQIKVINAIYQDVVDLLSRNIKPAIVKRERYSQSTVALDEELFLNDEL